MTDVMPRLIPSTPAPTSDVRAVAWGGAPCEAGSAGPP